MGMVKGDVELKIFHSLLKENNLFVDQNVSGNVIAFLGGRPLEGRLSIFNISRDKPWEWTDKKILGNPIEMQTHFRQEEKLHDIWDSTGKKNLTTIKFPRLELVPYAVVEWLSKKGRTPNELRVWLGKMMTIYANYKKEDWNLFFAFSMAAS